MSMWEPRSSHLYVGGGGACPSVPPVLSVRPSAGPGHGRSPREWEFIVCVCAVSVCPFSPLCADPRAWISVCGAAVPVPARGSLPVAVQWGVSSARARLCSWVFSLCRGGVGKGTSCLLQGVAAPRCKGLVV